MLKLKHSKELEDLRSRFQIWVSNNQPPIVSESAGLVAGRPWQEKLALGGFLGLGWPKEYGGGGMSLVADAIIQEELVRVAAPQIPGLFGISMVGPVLIKHGTKAQSERFLKDILSGKTLWCQGFSEPNAGSDLSAIATKAQADDKGFIVNGQKIWTSLAHVADWCFLLCRTSGQARDHTGLSYLLVDMKSKGITTRPLKQITGDDEFNEVFFDNVFVPKENLVGEVGEGWKIAISTLMYERVILTFARQLQSEVALHEISEKHKNHPDYALKKRLAQAIAKSCAVRALSYQHLLDYADGKDPGPEGSLDKLLWSETFQEICKIGLELEGAGEVLNPGEDFFRYLYSRGRTIAAGTSEIQRNIIAERLLGLPRLKLQA